MIKPLDPISNVTDIKKWLDKYNISYKSNTRKPDLIKLMNDYYDNHKDDTVDNIETQKESETNNMENKDLVNNNYGIMSQEDMIRQQRLNKMLANIDGLLSEANDYLNSEDLTDEVLNPGFKKVNEDPDIYEKESDFVKDDKSGMTSSVIRDAVYEEFKENNSTITFSDPKEDCEKNPTTKPDLKVEDDKNMVRSELVKDKNEFKKNINKKVTSKYTMVAFVSVLVVILAIAGYFFLN